MRHAEHINPSTGPMNPGFWNAYQKLGMPELTVLETVESDDADTLVYILNHKERLKEDVIWIYILTIIQEIST